MDIATKPALTPLEIEFETSILEPLEVKKFSLDKWEPLRGNNIRKDALLDNQLESAWLAENGVRLALSVASGALDAKEIAKEILDGINIKDLKARHALVPQVKPNWNGRPRGSMHLAERLQKAAQVSKISGLHQKGNHTQHHIPFGRFSLSFCD